MIQPHNWEISVRVPPNLGCACIFLVDSLQDIQVEIYATVGHFFNT